MGLANLSNIPSARANGMLAVDATRNRLWLFGGNGYAKNGVLGRLALFPCEMGIINCPLFVFIAPGLLNELWYQDVATGMWVWIAGDGVPNPLPIHGSKGVAHNSNRPGGRCCGKLWIDEKRGRIYLFGGNGVDSAAKSGKLQSYRQVWLVFSWTVDPGTLSLSDDVLHTGYLNDLWYWDVAQDQWVWESGSTTMEQRGSFGTMGVASADDTPGARTYFGAWTDTGRNRLYVIGGSGYDKNGVRGYLSDIWYRDLDLDYWVWEAGSDTKAQTPDYGEKQVARASNRPGASDATLVWLHKERSRVYLLRGGGFDKSGNAGRLPTH
jgi:hypothetical protein